MGSQPDSGTESRQVATTCRTNPYKLLTLKLRMWDKKVGVIPRSLCRPRLVGEPGDHRNKRYQEERNLVSLLEPLRDPRSDEELIVAFANGDVAAFKKLRRGTDSSFCKWRCGGV